MVSLLAAARGIVARRTAHDWLIAAAASLIILLATTLLSAGVIYSGAVSESGLRRSLADADPVAANVEVLVMVTDTQTGRTRTYANPRGTAFVPVQDTKAFGCP